MKRVAIVGAGLAGLASAWHLLDHYDITLFDEVGIGGGASGVATGLLHPFAGRQAVRSWRADEAMQATMDLLDVAEEALQKPVALRSGILRLAVADHQKKNFRKRAEEFSDAIWWSEEVVEEHLSGFVRAPALWIPSGITVFMKSYLEGLWLACQKKGAKLVREAVKDLASLASFDRIIIAAGAKTLELVSCPSLEPVKGQTIFCRWNEPPLPWSVSSLGHLSPTEDPTLCQLGATYERNFSHSNPTPEGEKELRDKIALFYPAASQLPLVRATAGIRLCPKEGYRPVIRKIFNNTWVLTGFGSKGLLYHALLSKELISLIN